MVLVDPELPAPGARAPVHAAHEIARTNGRRSANSIPSPFSRATWFPAKTCVRRAARACAGTPRADRPSPACGVRAASPSGRRGTVVRADVDEPGHVGAPARAPAARSVTTSSPSTANGFEPVDELELARELDVELGRRGGPHVDSSSTSSPSRTRSRSGRTVTSTVGRRSTSRPSATTSANGAPTATSSGRRERETEEERERGEPRVAGELRRRAAVTRALRPPVPASAPCRARSRPRPPGARAAPRAPAAASAGARAQARRSP